MDAAMTFNWLESQRATTAQTRQTREANATRLAQENARLMDENERLRRRCADLACSAEMWVRLYEAALQRAGESPDDREA
jgi:regulator of replication initiation timing